MLGRTFKVLAKAPKSMGHNLGLCHFDTSTLDYATGQLPIEEADTVLHELFHAILFSQGREYAGEVEELYVRALASGLIVVLRDNPRLAEWLTSVPK